MVVKFILFVLLCINILFVGLIWVIVCKYWKVVKNILVKLVVLVKLSVFGIGIKWEFSIIIFFV